MSRKSREKTIRRTITWQEESNKRQAEHAALLNYGYGEQAANEAQKRQNEFYDKTYAMNTVGAKMRQIEEAGASYGLLAGGGMGGGASGGVPAMGSGAGNQQGKGADIAAAQAAANQQEMLKLEKAKGAAEISLMGAQSMKAAKETQEIDQDVKMKAIREPIEWEGLQKTIESIMAETENKNVARSGMRLQNAFDEIRNKSAGELHEYTVDKLFMKQKF